MESYHTSFHTSFHTMTRFPECTISHIRSLCVVAMEVKLPIACLVLQTLLLLTTVKETHCYRENGDLKGGRFIFYFIGKMLMI